MRTLGAGRTPAGSDPAGVPGGAPVTGVRWGALARSALFGAIVSAAAVGLAYLQHPSSSGFLVAVFMLAWLVATIWAYARAGKA